jgi:diaminopimelate epimerase
MRKNAARQGSRFYKLHGAGNDILVLPTEGMPKRGKAEFVRKVSHRHLGIGCDQVVEVLSTRPLAIQIWNGDGTQAEMCANGTRCFLFLAAAKGWFSSKLKEVPLHVSGKPYTAFKGKGGYELCLGEPEIDSLESLSLDRESIPFWPVRTGNPHAVILTTSHKLGWAPPSSFCYREFGAKIEVHARFPKKTNVEFIRTLEQKGNSALVRVEAWERGAGATLSCGTGAVAAAAVVRGLTGVSLVEVAMTLFQLRVRFEGERAFLSGPSALVAEGTYFL